MLSLLELQMLLKIDPVLFAAISLHLIAFIFILHLHQSFLPRIKSQLQLLLVLIPPTHRNHMCNQHSHDWSIQPKKQDMTYPMDLRSIEMSAMTISSQTLQKLDIPLWKDQDVKRRCCTLHHILLKSVSFA